MSQQPLNLQRSFRIVRRHLRVFWAFVGIGLLVGVVYTVAAGPSLSATALVVLPQVATQTAEAQAETGVASSDVIDTEVLIADSDPVLTKALPHVSPAMSLSTLQKRVQVTDLTESVVSITANGSSAAQAETTANAVASSYMAYITSSSSPVGPVEAKLLESAGTATGPSLPERLAIDGLLGVIAGVLVGFVVALAVGRREARIKERDRMANSIGVPVIGSFPASRPADSAGWTRLIAEYEPDADHAQQLRAVLKRIGVSSATPDDGDEQGAACSVTVLSLTSDPAALAVGPQLASFAASEGIPTALIIGPQPDHAGAKALRSAGTATPIPEGRRRLRIVVADDGDVSVPGAARLVVVVAATDPKAPRIRDAVATTAAALAVSPGVVTPKQLSQAASAATGDGRELIGIVVADPAPGDETTGRNPRLGEPMRHPQPTRV